MTERRAMEPFETQFANRVRVYTDVATERRIDPLEVSRTAMSSRRPTDLLGRRWAGVGWTGAAVAVVAVVAVGIVAVALLGRPSDTTGGPVPEVIQHSWQRPVLADPDPTVNAYGTAFLNLVGGQMEFGRELGPGASKSAIAASGVDTLAVTATAETVGCAIGDAGTYRWSLEGKGTVMTLTAIGVDSCAAREGALAGPWVRADLPPPAEPEATLPPGTYETSSFDPVGDPARPSRLSYIVSEGWKVKEDKPVAFLLHHLADAAPGQPSADTFLALFNQPRMLAVPKDGAACADPIGEAPGVGTGVDDLVAAIRARAGVVSTAPTAVKIGGYDGLVLDLRLAASWTRGCVAPEGAVVGVPIIQQAGSGTGPGVGLVPDRPVRLILLDLTGGRTLAISIFEPVPSQPSVFEAHAAEVMPIIESFEFPALTP